MESNDLRDREAREVKARNASTIQLLRLLAKQVLRRLANRSEKDDREVVTRTRPTEN